MSVLMSCMMMSSPSTTPLSSSPSESSPSSAARMPIPGSYGWPIIGPLSDRLNYTWFQGPEKFFKTRIEKFDSKVFRTNLPPTFPFFLKVNPNVVALLDVKSFSYLFDMEIVEKNDVLVGDFMPSVKFTGGTRVCAYLDTSEPKHTQEMVKPPTSKNEQDQGQISAKSELPLSDFINFRIAWPAEIQRQETTISDKRPEETKRFWGSTGLAADNFFFKLTDVGTTGTKAVAGLDNQNLFQNVQSSDPADGSAMSKTTESFSEWQADFQFAVSDNQHAAARSSVQVMGSPDDSGNKIQDSQALHFASSEVDLSAHLDSVFVHKEDLTVGKPMDNPVASPALGDWNSDDLWTNMGRNETRIVGESDATVCPKDPYGNLDNLSTSADFFQDFQWQTNNEDVPANKTMDGELNTMDVSQTVSDFDIALSAKDDRTLEISNNLSAIDDISFEDFEWKTNAAGVTSNKTVNDEPSTNKQSQIAEVSFATINTGDNHTSKKSNDPSTSVDLFQDFQWQTNKTDLSENKRMHEENNTVDGDAFDEWDDFTGSASLQDPSQNEWIQNDHLTTSHRYSADIDVFSPHSTFDGRDIDGFSEPNLFSTYTVNKSSAAENDSSSKPSVIRKL
ncbi:uncharacterized protein LOC142523419 isoform X3 [Primulina tabacum]|uniref:uncharacterized protein LOC142523419 isoform X3 n=1 Tax=Primulina tabacum TaxID=48773 RepID=UPI003F5A73EF